MRKIALLISGCLIGSAALPSNSCASQLVEMRLILEKPSGDAEQMTLEKETLFVQKAVLLNQGDLKAVAVSTNRPIGHPQSGLVFEFTEQGWKHFSEVTHRNKGERLAIVIDGQIYATPVIRREGVFQSHFQYFEFHRPFTQEKATELAAKIDSGLQKRL